MDSAEQNRFIEIYKKCGDDELVMMIDEGEDSFQEGAYELIIAEAKRRGLVTGNDSFYVEGSEGEINFADMSNEDLMGVLVNIHNLDELNFHMASAEAVRRNIDSSDIRAFKSMVQKKENEQCTECAEKIEVIENPHPLIILNSYEEVGLFVDKLYDEEIPFEIQINVDGRDYKKAEMATSELFVLPEDE